MGSFFYNTYKPIQSRKKLASILMLCLLFGLGFIASKLQFEEDITKLIPMDEGSKNIQKILKTTNFADKIIINIERDTNGTVENVTKYASSFIDSLEQFSGTYIKNIQGRVDDKDIQKTLDFIYTNLPLFLDREDYLKIFNKLDKDSLNNRMLSNYKMLISPTGAIVKKTILRDPLGLSFLGLEKLRQLSAGDDFIFQDGFLFHKDKNNLLLFLTPNFETNNTTESAFFVENLQRLQSEFNKNALGKVKSQIFGGSLIAVANAKQIKNDIQLTVAIAISVLLILLTIFYRKLSITVILFTPTLFGGLLAAAGLFLLRTKVSAISLGIGAVLLGITLDYSLHILTHIRNNTDVKSLYKSIVIPTLMSSLTTASAFLCLLFLNSQALQDLGIFAAISVVGASIFALLFIPQVYVSNKESKITFLDRVANQAHHKHKWRIIVLSLLLVVSAFTYKHVTFNKDISKLNFMSPELIEAEKKLDKLNNLSSKSIYVVAYGDSLFDVLDANDAVFNKLEALKEEGSILNFNSIAPLVHSKEAQNEKINQWRDFWQHETKTKTKSSLVEIGNELGFKNDAFKSFYNLLETSFSPLTVNDYSELKTILVDDFITTKNKFSTAVSLLKVDEAKVQEVIASFKNTKNVIAIDRQGMTEGFLENLKSDFNRLIGYSMLVVFLILLVSYKSFSLTLVTGLPILLTWLLIVGVMGLFNIEFNVFNIVICTFIFGLGIDYCIFMTNGMLQEYRMGKAELPSSKTSIILSVITTILGVGVLVFAKHPALRSIALVSMVGILSAVQISFIIQPLLFKLFIGDKTKAPVPLRLLLHSIISFTYFGLGGLLLSLFSVTVFKILPVSKKTKMKWFHMAVSKFMKSVLYSNPYFKTRIINDNKESFDKQCIIIANHSSFLDILSIGMLHPKIIFLVNDWVYNSPVFGKAVQLAGFYPVSSGIDEGVNHLKEKLNQGYSLMVFPEGTRSSSNKLKRFHKGAFFLANHFQLDIVPVLIHGNSEINPKGSFLIKNGNLTLKILDRIPPNDMRFENSYSKQTKGISTLFKDEFLKFRKEMEKRPYFHDRVLENYRYKGDALYNTVKSDLKQYGEIYQKISEHIGHKDSIIHLSEDQGQLDCYLSLVSMKRKLISYIENPETRTINRNSYIVNKHNNFLLVDTLEEVLLNNADTLVLNLNTIEALQLKQCLDNGINSVVLLKNSCDLPSAIFQELGFTEDYRVNDLIILKK